MFEKTKKFLGINQYSEGDENFIRLMQLAREDENIRERLLSILAMQGQQRQTALNAILAAVKQNGAPQEFVDAVVVLRDEEVAARALVVLKGF
ncbi:MAG: hypothetical protein ACI9CE_003551 [Flavobacterium sp.]|jgi:hypothetical protein